MRERRCEPATDWVSVPRAGGWSVPVFDVTGRRWRPQIHRGNLRKRPLDFAERQRETVRDTLSDKIQSLMLRATIATPATAQAGSVRVSASEARQRLQAGGSGATLSKKLATRRSEAVMSLMPAGSGLLKPPPERLFFAPGADGEEAYDAAMAAYTATDLCGNAMQVVHGSRGSGVGGRRRG